MRDSVREKEALLLRRLNAGTAVLPGGYRIVGEASPARAAAVGKLMPESLYEQLELHVGERRIA